MGKKTYFLRPQPGDLVFTRGPGLFSALIRWASRSFGEAKTAVNHVGVITRGGSLRQAELAEARWHYKVHNLFKAYANSGHRVAIYRAKNIQPATRLLIAERAASFACASSARRRSISASRCSRSSSLVAP